MTLYTTMWRIAVGDKIRAGLEWADALEGSTISGVPTISGAPAGLSCSYINTVGIMTWFWLEGDPGPGRSTRLKFTISTAEGERLSHEMPVFRKG